MLLGRRQSAQPALPAPTAITAQPPPVAEQPAAPPPQAPPQAGHIRPGKLVLSTNALTTRVFLDKSPTDKSENPVAAGGMSFKIEVPPNVYWTLRVEADGYRPVSMPLIIGAGEETTLPVVMMPSAPEAAPPPPARRPVARAPQKAAQAPAAPAAKPETPAKPSGNENIVNPF
jgi:hypothetical protein